MNWIAHFESDWNEESWRVQTDWKEVGQAYDGWHPSLAALFARTETCYKWALLDRDPLNAWTKGRVTLLGDAAHPMLPYLAQGAAMAVEDGYVVAALLDMHRSNPQLALKQYEQIRLPRTARVQLTARERSKTNHLTSPLARRLALQGEEVAASEPAHLSDRVDLRSRCNCPGKSDHEGGLTMRAGLLRPPKSGRDPFEE